MKKIRKIIIALIILVLLAGAGYLVYTKYFNKTEEPIVKVEKKIEGYGYTLDENETDLYKEEFDNLESILEESEVDYEEYAKSISKLFVIDFYTLDNKLSKNDIGGTMFIRKDIRDNFIDKARSTFYKYVEIKEGRTQKLPIVSGIEDVTVEKTTYTIKKISKTTTKKAGTATNVGETVEAYKVVISWTYEEDLGYETYKTIYLVQDGKKLSIIEID